MLCGIGLEKKITIAHLNSSSLDATNETLHHTDLFFLLVILFFDICFDVSGFDISLMCLVEIFLSELRAI